MNVEEDDDILVIDLTPINKPIGIVRRIDKRLEKYLIENTHKGFLKLTLMEVINE